MRRNTVVAMMLCALVFVALGAGQRDALGAVMDDTPRTAIVSAYEPEWALLQSALDGRRDHVDNGVRFVTGTLDGRPVVLVLSGVSMTNAAMTTQMLLDRFNVSEIVVSGIAGGVDPALSLGDVSVAEAWSPHTEAVYGREVAPGMFTADVPFFDTSMPNYGMVFPVPVDVRRDGQETPVEMRAFPVDPTLLAAARRARAVAMTRCNADACLDEMPELIIGGTGVSGSVFVDNAEFREYLGRVFEARVADMETAAIAHVAYANGVPYIAFRSVSDLAGGNDGANEMPVFFAIAAENSAAAVRAFLKEL